ncbi:MAG: flagellar FliJ family protein [Candidatus Sericytochromatia bacterium]|nr:flagellar FliJ family protein [Candidatus Sericytochromatia bacterium]
MPAKFRYRMATVLELRVKREDKLTQEKAKLERARDQERDARDELKARLAAARRSMGASLAAGQASNVQMGNDYAAVLEKKLADQELRLKQAELAVDRMEQDLKLAKREVKILEKHREKAKERWVAEVARKDAMLLDEMAVQGYLKKERLRIEEDEQEAAREAALAQEPESPWMAGLMQASQEPPARRLGLVRKEPS